MMKILLICSLFTFASVETLVVNNAYAQEDQIVELSGPNRSDEPIAEEYSLVNAAKFLDVASVQWQDEHNCMTCHTNYAYLYARPAISTDSAAHDEVRRFAEQLVLKRWKEQGPRWDAEVVATASALAFNDASTTEKLHPATRTALDRIWTVQRADGGFDWLKCGWPPMESDDHYGVTLAAIAVGVAPEAYAQSEPARKGMKKIHEYLADNAAPTLHHRAMLLWAASYQAGLITEEAKQLYVKELLAKQQDDGGWSLASLGDWKRADGKEQDAKTSDGYGTGFVVFVLRRAGVALEDPQIQKAIQWLKSNQRESGRWYTRSLNRDNHHFISHAGTAMAVMALSEHK